MQGIAQKILAAPGKYSIQQLTQAVQNGLVPAYIAVPIIQDKVQQQKQSQMMQQGQQAQPNMPPIAQQVMSEAQGLQALPTNLPQSYAGGGIVAFEEGGPVQRFRVGGMGNVSTPYSATNPNAAFNEFLKQMGLSTKEYVNSSPGTQKNIMDMFNSGKPAVTAMPPTAAPIVQTAATAAESSLPYRAGQAVGNAGRSIGAFVSDGLSGAAKRLTGIAGLALTPSEIADDQAVLAAMRGESYKGQPYDVVNARKVLEAAGLDPNKAPAPQKNMPTQEVPTDKAPAGDGRGIDTLPSNLGLGGNSALGRGPGLDIKPPDNNIVSETKSLVEGFNTRDAARTTALDAKIQEAEGKVTGKAYEGLESSLRKEAEEFGADKAQAKNMAIFKAGLAMMAGTSRHALENIGKGAMVGAEDYQAAAKDLKKAQKENERAMAMVEQARRAENIGDRDKAISRMDQANQHLAERDKFGTSAIVNATGKSAELSNDIWKTQFSGEKALQAAEIAGRYSLAGAQARANRESGITPYQMARLRGDAEKRVDADAVRAQLAKSLGLTKTPAPGADKGFDSKFNTQYENEVAAYINRVLGMGSGGGGGASTGKDPYAGYKIVP